MALPPNWTAQAFARQSAEQHKLPRIVSIQNQYSLANRTYEIGLAELTIKEKVGLLVYSALNMGALTGKYLDDAWPEGARFTMYERNRERYLPARAQPAYRRYVELARDHGLDPAALAIAFAASRQFTTSVIIGATSVEQLKTDIDAGEVALSAEVLSEIESIHRDFPDITH